MNWINVGLMSAVAAAFAAIIVGLCWVAAQIATWLEFKVGRWVAWLFAVLVCLLFIIGLNMLGEWSVTRCAAYYGPPYPALAGDDPEFSLDGYEQQDKEKE